MLDIETREVSSPPTDFTVGIEEEFAILDPRTLRLAQRFQELSAAAPADQLAGRVGGRRADRSPRSRSARPRRGPGRRRGPPARRPGGACSPGGRAGRALGATAPTLEPVAGAADHRHRSLPPRGARASSTSPGATTPSALHAHVGVRGADRAVAVCDRLRARAARAAGHVGQLALPRRARLRPALGAHADLHQELPPLRDTGALRQLPRPTPTTSTSWSGPTRSSSTPSSGGASVPTTPSGRSRCGSATPSPPPRRRPRSRA